MADAVAHPSRTDRLVRALHRSADRPWFLPAVSLFPLADYALPFLPNQALLMGLAALEPKRWRQLAACFVLAAAIGAWLVAYAIQAIGPALLDMLGGMPAEGAASGVRELVEAYGLLALGGLALFPWPPRTGVVICALAGLSPLGIAVAVGLGRLMPAAACAAMGAKSPDMLRRLPLLGSLLPRIAVRESPKVHGGERRSGSLAEYKYTG